jgi:hypothetical protein
MICCNKLGCLTLEKYLLSSLSFTIRAVLVVNQSVILVRVIKRSVIMLIVSMLCAIIRCVILGVSFC